MNNSEIPPRLLTCNCQSCNEQIEFDAGGVPGGETITLDCPHCKAETTTTIPPTPAEIEQAKVEQAEQLIIREIVQIKDSLRARMQNGKPLFLYESVFIPVDSVLCKEELASKFDLSVLRNLGLQGWDVVQAVPRTIGIGLENIGTNVLGTEWGGGVGGNVSGVHIIVKKSISLNDLTDDPADEVGEFIRLHLEEFNSDQSESAL